MFSSTYNNASGYEPKPGAQLALSSPIKRQQISDAQLVVFILSRGYQLTPLLYTVAVVNLV